MTELKEEVTVHERKVVDLVGNVGNQSAIPLTKKNAYRVTSIKRVGTDEDSVSFHFRKLHTGMNSYAEQFIKDHIIIARPPPHFGGFKGVQNVKNYDYAEKCCRQKYDLCRFYCIYAEMVMNNIFKQTLRCKKHPVFCISEFHFLESGRSLGNY